MRLHYLQHVPFENPGSILDWAERAAIALTGSHLYRGEPLPRLDDFDALVVMGGPMGLADDQLYSWMAPEIKFIASAIRAEKKVLGICLGAQMLADVLGARVYPNGHKEIGWFPITWKEAARSLAHLHHMPAHLAVFHWHSDTFDLPAGARQLASSSACAHQAFQYGESVLALQFHLEVKEENVRALLLNSDELVNAHHIQNRAEILAGTKECDALNVKMQQLLDKFFIG
ncbi:type 1 glutamine amidotransferase [candidate division KSB1 bacterium]|nr:type 1 glutamine amidotransferase [candidate division KSB1 bacterium]RQW03337.1 MAG: type 1 glutamine amidotransferase [candidate division KSB1 bacterium]